MDASLNFLLPCNRFKLFMNTTTVSCHAYYTLSCVLHLINLQARLIRLNRSHYIQSIVAIVAISIIKAGGRYIGICSNN